MGWDEGLGSHTTSGMVWVLNGTSLGYLIPFDDAWNDD